MIGSVETVEETPQRASIPHGIGESSKPPPTALKPSENAPPKAASKPTPQPVATAKAECSRELQPIIEAEQRRAAISGVEATLLPLTNRSSGQFVDFMRVYLRAAIAQYMATCPTTTPPVLPPRPANPLPRAPDARSSIIFAVPVLPVKNNWATVAKNGLRQKAVPIEKAVPRPAAKASLKDAPKAKVDKRLFIRLGRDHPWGK
ncbi:EKA-like protein [Blumeria hordei DH14]|uniref:EKA-like protein n=1 Tax=Blumeria graminis f. sp. hordei (strain DH14) TaxID=546991 RepID=N1J4Z9_BLUG1|nr:EKA-like protein [Blumeria hordei DH14]